MTMPWTTAEAAPGTVLTVIQKGYVLNGRLLRGQIQQTLDGVARPVNRPRFDQLGNGVQGHHHGGPGCVKGQEQPLGPLEREEEQVVEKERDHAHVHA